MFLNSFKLAIRKLLKNRAHSFINIAGLSVGMAVAILIGLWMLPPPRSTGKGTYSNDFKAVALASFGNENHA